MNARWIGSITLCGLLALCGQAVAQDLGVGRGIDHVASLVRPENFDDQVDVMSRQLGFPITPALLSPIGAKNRLIWFGDLSYLEVLTITEAERLHRALPGISGPVRRQSVLRHRGDQCHPGDRLPERRGLSQRGAGPGGAAHDRIDRSGGGLSPLWSSILLTSRLAPPTRIFSWTTTRPRSSEMFADFPALAPRPHPNTAEKIETLWLVVPDLDAAIDFYEGLGLEVRFKNKKVQFLGGRGAEVRYGNRR